MAQINAGRVRFVSRGEYNNTTQYYTFDLVNYNGNSYYAKENTLGNLPTNATYWQVIAEQGNGISRIEKTSTSGLVDTYTIYYTNNTTTTFNVSNGRGITSVEKISTEDNVDTYRITFNDGTTFDYEITNGDVSHQEFEVLEGRVEKLEDNQLKTTATGTSINVDDAFDTNVRNLEFHKETTQFTTTGKNLFNKYGNFTYGTGVDATSLLSNGQVQTISNYGNNRSKGQLIDNLTANTDYTISGTVISANGNYSNNVVIEAMKTSGSGYIARKLISSSETKPYNWSFTFNTGEETSFWLSLNGWKGTADNSTTIFDNIMVSANGGDYEPYTGGKASPSPDFPQSVNVLEGYKNLFDKSATPVYSYKATVEQLDTGVKISTTDTSNRFVAYNILDMNDYKGKKISLSVIMNSNNTNTGEIKLIKNGATGSGSVLGGTLSTSGEITYTIPNVIDENEHYLGIRVSSVGSSASYTNFIITESAQKVAYVPYDNKNYVSLKVQGKNLLPFINQDFTYKNVRYYCQNGNLYLDGTSTGETLTSIPEFKNNFSFWLNAGTYYFTKGSFIGTYLKKYDDNSNIMTASGTFTLLEKTRLYLGFYVYNQTFTNQAINCQIEVGSTATSFEPYQENIIPIPLNNNWLAEKGAYADKYYIDQSTGKHYILKNFGKVILNGTETWGSRTNSNSHKELYTTTSIRNNRNSGQLCNYGVNNSSTFNFGSYGDFCLLSNDHKFYIVVDDSETTDSFKAKLQQNNLICYCPLVTPTLVEVSAVDIELFNGINNISNSEDATMKIEYVQDINIVINKLTNAIIEIGGE